ncbi:MAG TPA: CPBP family intramembrane metalloprotease [Pirellulaceae bacterium]|nr:CPBP family intramembrane metalloprotease [Pirellulaceae bacterium]HMO93795.1 CPBP family intramembrane metalloprotease [Pirellulaceae bacterium]HMP70611.1 CPBP family intramembrane metalloprotease [Pirellulaceae bacterium]
MINAADDDIPSTDKESHRQYADAIVSDECPVISSSSSETVLEVPAVPRAKQDAAEPNLMVLVILVQGGLLGLALILAWLLQLYDTSQPLSEWLSWPWLSGTWLGLVAALPLFFVAIKLSQAQFAWSRNFSTRTEELLRTIFKDVSVPGLIWISICAGVSEEMLFRWSLQGGMAAWFNFPGGAFLALTIASVIFGVLHWIDRIYALLATAAGFYMGMLMLATGTVVVPMVAHAAYDFMILYWLLRIKRPDQQ